MPLELDCEIASDRPLKRRKLQGEFGMARQTMLEDKDPQRQGDQGDVQVEAGCEMPASPEQSSSTPQAGMQTSDRDELIQCIKRGQRPTWVPKAGLKALYAEEEAIQEKRNAQTDHEVPLSPSSTSFQFEHDLLFGPWTTGTGVNGSFEQSHSTLDTGYFDDIHTVGTAASHNNRQSSNFFSDESRYPLSTSPTSWLGLEDPSYPLIGQAVSGARARPALTPLRMNRSRAPSLSSSFVMRVPTSPLVNAVNNPNLDFSPRTDCRDNSEGGRNARRRTMPPNSFQSASSLSIESTTPNFSRPLPHPTLRRESTFPYQAPQIHQGHQPRRSIGSFTFQSSSGLQTPRTPGRRCSLATDMSPMRRTSMVGSFEESILRGRMSAPASKPFDFLARIGVMGKGDCPTNLKCPAHVSVPFQAVFYSYPSSQTFRSIADDAPSPYVGTIDLENNLKPVQLATKKKRCLVRGVDMDPDTLLSNSDPTAPENTPIGKALAREAREAQLQQQAPKSPSSSRMNLGGAYRVPEQGQLQIIIKNSNETAVKLFLVPYDLQGMEPGTKTFIRQRSYSSGPITEGALSDRAQQPDRFDPLKDKNILRYLIHIKFCCPSKGKFYLYDNIRVVFANRVPDGKEKLRNEVQLPEPRYSPWRAVKTPQRSASSSVDFSPMAGNPRFTSSPGIHEDVRIMKLPDTESIPEEAAATAESKLPFRLPEPPRRSNLQATDTIVQSSTSFAFPDISGKEEPTWQPEQAVSSVSGFFASTSPRSSPIPWTNGSSPVSRSFSPAPLEAGRSLLSRQLRGLHGSISGTDFESSPNPWAATASLTRILSQDDIAPDETKGLDDD